MDRVFKRVAEGVALFDATYDKVQMATNQSQKEKLEQVSSTARQHTQPTREPTPMLTALHRT